MAKKICTQCGTVGRPGLHTQGSIFIELFLWLFFILPGVIYSIWRHASRTRGCRACGGGHMVPLDSPVGKKMLAAGAVDITPEPAPQESKPAAVKKPAEKDNVISLENEDGISVYRIPA